MTFLTKTILSRSVRIREKMSANPFSQVNQPILFYQSGPSRNDPTHFYEIWG